MNKHGYLKPNQWKNGNLTWSRNETKIASISIRVDSDPDYSYLELSYRNNDIPIKYRVQLITVPSNLGKGVIWYFVCPHTGKRCRKLYLGETYFYHRTAFRGCMYEKQTHSKKWRQLNKTFGKYFEFDELYERLYSKHFKKYYSGKPTKIFLKLIQQIQKSKSISELEIERFLLNN